MAANRGSQPSAELRYPPQGSPIVFIKFFKWQFFTSKGLGSWDNVYLSEDDAKRLKRELERIYPESESE